MNVQIIEKDGQPEWAVIPYREYQLLVDALEEKTDAAAIAEALRRLEAGAEERIPAQITARLLSENPYKVWREYRGLTQDGLATAAGISKGYVSMIESAERMPSAEVKRTIARVLGVDEADLD